MRAQPCCRLLMVVAVLGLLGCDKSSDGESPGTRTATGDGETKSSAETRDADGAKPKPQVYDEPVERRLHSDKVEASSFLWTDWNRFQENYHPNYILDGDPTTAWVEGADNSGAGSWIRIHVSPVEAATRVRLRLRNGYHKSESLFEKNARAQRVVIETLPGKHAHEATLTDVMDWQEVAFDQPSGPIEGIQIRVDSVYEGSKYSDLCISDVELFVTGKTKDNAAYEKAKLDKILGWKTARIAMADAFKSGKNKELPVTAGYRVTTTNKTRIETDSTPDLGFWLDEASGKVGEQAALDRAKAALSSEFKGWTPVDHAIETKRKVPEVDGLYHAYPDELAGWWARADAFMLPVIDDASLLTGVGLSLFGAKRSFGTDGPDKCPRNKTFMWRPPQDKGPQLSQLLILHCAVVEEREGQYVERVRQLLGFDDQGRLNLLVSGSGVQTFSWDKPGPAGKIVSGTRLAQHGISTLETKKN